MGTTGDVSLSVEEVTQRRQWGDFLALPHRLYATDPAWVAPLNFEQRQRFSPRNHFFEHARMKAWIVRRGGLPVGRITAQVDELHLRQHADAAGYFGMLEAEDEPGVFAALFGAAQDWLREQGMERVRGPFNLHINEEVGLLVDGFSTPPFVLMGHARPYYGPRVEAQGYRGVKDLLAYHVHPDFDAPRVMTRLAERASATVTVRPLRRKQLAADAAIMRDVFNDAWQNNWGFVPLAEAEWVETVSTLAKLMPDE